MYLPGVPSHAGCTGTAAARVAAGHQGRQPPRHRIDARGSPRHLANASQRRSCITHTRRTSQRVFALEAAIPHLAEQIRLDAHVLPLRRQHLKLLAPEGMPLQVVKRRRPYETTRVDRRAAAWREMRM